MASINRYKTKTGLLLLLVAIFLFCGCRAPEYVVLLTKNTPELCIVKIGEANHYAYDARNEYKIKIRKKDYIHISASFQNYNTTGTMRLSLIEDGMEIATTEGAYTLWISYSAGTISTSTNSTSSSSGSGGGSSAGSTTCGAPTKDGTPCQRRVSGGGYCWQHK